MAQNDFVIADQTASAALADINSALQSLASCSSGATQPSVRYANQLWYDTSTHILKVRNEANSAWINILYVHQADGAVHIIDNTYISDTSGNHVGLLGDQASSEWTTGTGTTESLVSPAKVKAAIQALVPSSLQVFVPSKTWSSSWLQDNGPNTYTTSTISLPAGYYRTSITITMTFNGAGSNEAYSTTYSMRHIRNGSTVVLKGETFNVGEQATSRTYTLNDQIHYFAGNDQFQIYQPDINDPQAGSCSFSINFTASGPFSNAVYA